MRAGLPWMGLVPFRKRDSTELPGSFCHVRTQWEKGHLYPGRGPSLEPNSAGILISGFQPPEVGEINFCCLQATPSVAFCYSSPSLAGTLLLCQHTTVTVCAGRIIKWFGQGTRQFYFSVCSSLSYSAHELTIWVNKWRPQNSLY